MGKTAISSQLTTWRRLAFWFLLPVATLHMGAKWLNVPSPFNRLLFSKSPILADYVCSHDYHIEIMSFDPVVFYINGFLKEAEIQHLLAITKDGFVDSMVYLPNGTSVVDKEFRTSKSAMIPHNDPVARCLDKRMKSLLGNIQHETTEKLQLVRYGVGEEFVLHNDWLKSPRIVKSPDGTDREYNRLASLFVYLEDDCIGGETYFPQVASAAPTADGTKFSRSADGEGLLVRPKRGNGVFWNTARMNGTGDERMYHSSLPVESGVKTGMNLFGLYFLDTPFVGQHNYDVAK